MGLSLLVSVVSVLAELFVILWGALSRCPSSWSTACFLYLSACRCTKQPGAVTGGGLRSGKQDTGFICVWVVKRVWLSGSLLILNPCRVLI